MKLSLYGVGAKCFGMAGDTVKQKVALAHQRVLVASRMCEEFLKAAEMYLECDRPDKAALCLLNARERELAAQLFEKLGQFERAGEIYSRLRLPLASNRCYEPAGHFNRAVEVLYENENYDMAVDILRRYKMKIEEYERRAEPIPQSLTNNKPLDKFSEERLRYMSANLFHKQDNRVRMLAALDRLPRWQDKVQFLREKEYVMDAAQAMEDNGQGAEATKLLLIYGDVDQAELMARKTRDENTIAHTLLVSLEVIMSRQPEVRPPTNDLHMKAMEAKKLFHSCKNIDGFADASLLLAELSDVVPDVRESMLHILDAQKAFLDLKPYGNLADYMLPKTEQDKELLLKYDTFYDLFTTKPDYVIYFPRTEAKMQRHHKRFTSIHGGKEETCREDINSFTSCENILQDLIPMGHHHIVFSNEYPREVLRKMGKPVKDYIKAFMEKRCKEDTEGAHMFGTYAAKSADVFLMAELCSHLFSIDFNVDSKMRDFEFALSKEQNDDNKEKDYKCLALMTDCELQNKPGSQWIVESLARRFHYSYFHLSMFASDPLEALTKFSNFVALISTKTIEVLPDRKFILVWLEFYTTLSFFLIAKVHKEMHENFSKVAGTTFIVPASYLYLMDFIEATFPRQDESIQKALNRFIPRKNNLVFIQDRLDHIVVMLCGSSKISLINVLFAAGLDNFFNCAMAERVFVLAMTLVSNVGTFKIRAMLEHVKSETALVQALTRLHPPEKCPNRLRLALEAVHKARCIRDVGVCLKALLRERENEKLMCCEWIPIAVRKDHEGHVQSYALRKVGFLPAYFLDEYTLVALNHGAGLEPVLSEPLVDNVEETQMFMEENVKWKYDAIAREKFDIEKADGIKIHRLFRSLAFAAKCRILKVRVKNQMAKEEQDEKNETFRDCKSD
ncbi:hypothetical protein CHS0354_019578 [Potamilus streckersoni]|uniref:Uncharacterized protein n=1 Tax=Potamilus streckersoni TaxID=2493646 RepID=A0AAE0TGQ4_9BIVA|nr:hypothetical protein CHS0354_019578 [Potamilus streckersoni]